MGSEPTERDDATTDALDLERALSTRQVAELLGAAEITLAQWRARGEGPRFFKIGKRHVRYRLADVLAYRDARTCGRRIP